MLHHAVIVADVVAHDLSEGDEEISHRAGSLCVGPDEHSPVTRYGLDPAQGSSRSTAS